MRFLIVAVSFLIAGALLVFTLGRVTKQATTPKQPAGWNSSAIHSSFQGVQVKEVDLTHAALVFSYDLENTTDSDYHLASDAKVSMVGRLKTNGNLKPEDSIKLDRSIFLPARNRATLTLEVSYPFNWPTQMFPGQVGPITQEKFRSFVAGKVADLYGFTLLDEAAHYRIEFPNGWQELQPAAAVAGID
jgi:hypothetical protein